MAKSLVVATLVWFTFAHPHESRGPVKLPHPHKIIDDSIEALGGQHALRGLKGVTYESADIFRTSTLMQNYKLFTTDRYIVNLGSQNLSFSFSDNKFQHRIDRVFQHSDYFFFANPTIPPGHFSLVMQNGTKDGYACYVEGNNLAFIAPDQVAGYADSALTEYLLFQANKFSPKLLIDIWSHQVATEIVEVNHVENLAVHDYDLNITVIFDAHTHYPKIIRSFEDHAIFGLTTHDLVLSNYAEASGIQFPHRRMVLYNGSAILEDTTVSRVSVNPPFAPGFFDGLEANETQTRSAPPKRISGYTHAEIGEYWYNTLWGGEYTGTYNNLSVVQPASDLPRVHKLLFLDSSNLEQLVLEFDDAVIVFEAPPHQTDLVIRWVKEKLKKPITHLWPSHHHHDHNYDVRKYVQLGAKIIVPEVSASYWRQIPNAKLITFNEKKPYIHSDGKMQARFLWRPESAHSVDWTYSIITSACPSANSTMLTYVADAWSTSVPSDPGFARSWLEQASADGLSRNTLAIPAHGEPTPLEELINELAFEYPDYKTTDFKTGGNICLEHHF
ncbi:metallo-beta-lactamase superfamily protein [Trichoderma barbatum]